MNLQLTGLQKVVRLQQEMIKAGCTTNTDEVCPVTHHHAPGLYAREMFIPKGALLVGKMHRYPHLVSMVGIIAILGHDESDATVIEGPKTFISPAMTKRAGLALTDTIWTTYHPTDKEDLDEIEADVIVPEREVLEMARMEMLS